MPVCDKTHDWLVKWGHSQAAWPWAVGGFVIGLAYSYILMHLILDHLGK